MNAPERPGLAHAARILLCAAMLVSLLASCGRTRQVVPGATVPTSERTETTTDGEPDAADTEDVGRDADHVIVIDPGHGFGDPGLVSSFTERTEAEIALAFSFRLYSELSDTVYLTHDGVSFPETKADDGNSSYDERERASFADEREAEYFISVHCNTYSGEGAEDISGSRVYVSSAAKAGKRAVRLAGEAMCAALNGTELGKEQSSLIVTPENDSYDVTTLADGVSLLLKLGYMSNEHDAREMTSDAWLERTARRAADAVDAYFPEN